MKGRYVILTAIAVLFIAALIVVFSEYKFFYHTVHWTGLVVRGVLAGLVMALIVTGILAKRIVTAQGILMTTLLTALFFIGVSPFIGHYLNRTLAAKSTDVRKVEFWAEEPVYDWNPGVKTPVVNGYRLFFLYNERMEEVRYKKARFSNIKRGTFIDVPMKKGLFGYECIIL